MHDDLQEELRRWMLGESFSCLGGRIAVRHDTLRTLSTGVMGATATTKEVHSELSRFVAESLHPEEDFASFVVLFDGPSMSSEKHFESELWAQLQALHELDRQGCPYAPDVSSDPASADFAFSVSGHPFFVVGLHPLASRTSRRFTVPAMVFNSHHQFRRLKASGVYQGLQRRIRSREVRLQGSVNPALGEFGALPEARQYSGRAPEEEWRCPFRPVSDTE
ncbi:guanitoxin biosynthesis heme-dependent pre-guanitoxin N-hydroxylase GntA [Streptomyces massasporeus]